MLVSTSCQEMLLSRSQGPHRAGPCCPGDSCLKPQALVVMPEDVGCAGNEDEGGAVAARDQTLEASDKKQSL